MKQRVLEWLRILMATKLLDLTVPMAFFQTCWDIFKADLLAVFQCFFDNAQFEKSLNATFFFSFIPKNLDAVEVKYFQPISLIGGYAKSFLKSWLTS